MTNRPVALVTGASSDIGKEPASALIAVGFYAVGTSCDVSGVAPFSGVTILNLNVARDASVAIAVQQVVELRRSPTYPCRSTRSNDMPSTA
ncbi:hypothetical protein [Streptomyces sp. P3]|uniref:hypothetical protein n=1 Tax=Streptomyces sp. P3 TaxID=2135430 RepID=UPI0026B18DEE